MPSRPPVRCKHKGCAGLVVPPRSYCTVHQRDKWRREKVKHSNNPFYKSSAWIKTRTAFIARYPACKQCGAKGVVVDHVQALSMGGDPFDWANLQTLCRACDQTKRGREAQVHLRLVKSNDQNKI